MNDFYIENKIYYHDTDSGGVVYYANYLKHLEEARTEFCLGRGLDLKKIAKEGIYFVVAHIDVGYKSSARYLDTIRISAVVEKISRASVNFVQKIKRQDTLLVEARVTWVCVSSDFKPRSIPKAVKELLQK